MRVEKVHRRLIIDIVETTMKEIRLRHDNMIFEQSSNVDSVTVKSI